MGRRVSSVASGVRCHRPSRGRLARRPHAGASRKLDLACSRPFLYKAPSDAGLGLGDAQSVGARRISGNRGDAEPANGAHDPQLLVLVFRELVTRRVGRDDPLGQVPNSLLADPSTDDDVHPDAHEFEHLARVLAVGPAGRHPADLDLGDVNLARLKRSLGAQLVEDRLPEFVVPGHDPVASSVAPPPSPPASACRSAAAPGTVPPGR